MRSPWTWTCSSPSTVPVAIDRDRKPSRFRWLRDGFRCQLHGVHRYLQTRQFRQGFMIRGQPVQGHDVEHQPFEGELGRGHRYALSGNVHAEGRADDDAEKVQFRPRRLPRSLLYRAVTSSGGRYARFNALPDLNGREIRSPPLCRSRPPSTLRLAWRRA